MANNTLKILLIIEGEIATTHLIEQVLNRLQSEHFSYRKVLYSNLLLDDLITDELPLFVRCCSPGLDYWVKALVEINKPYIYYLDDNFWELKDDSLLSRYYQHKLVQYNLNYVVSFATKVLTNSYILARYIANKNSQVSIVNAHFNFELLEGVKIEKTDEFRVGFSGSVSRKTDLNIISNIIEPILNDCPNVVFEFAGVLPKGISESSRVRFFPYHASYEEFIKFQASRSWKLALSPLVDSISNHSKTNNKYREYSACKVPGIYSDVQPYNSCINHGVTGLLVKNTDKDWKEAITMFANNDAQHAAIAIAAYEDVKSKHCLEVVAKDWLTEFNLVNDDILWREDTPKLNRIKLYFLKFFYRIFLYKLHIANAYSSGGMIFLLQKIVQSLVKSKN